MSKKIFLFGFALMVSALFIAGCSASNPEERRGEVTEEKPKTEEDAIKTNEDPQPITVKEPEAPVKVETIAEETPVVTEPVKNVYYSVQLGAFKEIANVEKFEKVIKSKFTLPIKTEPDPVNNTYKVTVGQFNSRDEAYKLRDYCVKNGYKDAWVVEVNK
jgi:cell division septation protein DedD